MVVYAFRVLSSSLGRLLTCAHNMSILFDTTVSTVDEDE